MGVTISFLIPVYNVEKYLDRCLRSVYSQINNNDHEVILVDDGSQDDSGKICDRYMNLYPNNTKVYHKTNEGISRTRNYLLNHASKDYIWFVDSDDFIQTNAVDVLICSIEKYGHPDIINFSYKHYNGNEFGNLQNVCSDIRNLSGDKYIKECNVNSYLWAHLFNLEFVRSKKVSFCEEINIMEDLLFILSLCCESKRILLTNVYGYNYFVGNLDSTMASKDKQHRLLNAEYSYKAIYELNQISEKYSCSFFYPELMRIISNTVAGFMYVFFLCNFDNKIVSSYIDRLVEINQYPIKQCSSIKASVFSKFANCRKVFLFACKVRNILSMGSIIKKTEL